MEEQPIRGKIHWKISEWDNKSKVIFSWLVLFIVAALISGFILAAPIPDVKGKRADNAVQTLKDYGFKNVDVVYGSANSDDMIATKEYKNYVVKAVKPSEKAKKSDRVKLVVKEREKAEGCKADKEHKGCN